MSQGLPPNQLSFNPETDVNLETGYKADLLDHRLKVNADIFYLYRHDAQIKTGFQSDPTNPDYFVFYTGNAASGHNYGLESDVEWRVIDRVTLEADLGSYRRISRISCSLAPPAPPPPPYRANLRMRHIGRQP